MQDLIKNKQIKLLVNKYGIFFILLGMIVIMSILKPQNFPTWPNAKNVLRQMTTVGIMAIGVTFPIITGGTDISGGSVLAMCSVIAAHFAHPGVDGVSGQYPLIVPILITLLAGVVVGIINGVVIGYGNVPPFIATLGMLSIARGIAMLLSDGRPIGNFTKTFNFIGGGSIFEQIPTPIIVFILCGVIGYIILHRTRFGTYVYAIGGNANAALVSGINVKLVTTSVYVLAGAFNAIAAIIITSRQQSGQPGVGVAYEMDAITCAVIGGASLAGGVGNILGTLIGAVIVGVLTNGMTMMQVDPNWQLVVKGTIIVAAVLIDMRKHRGK
jgi:ribose/xylose/arabinose/galactoside ABC-type transport system permease subunit